MLEAIDLVKQFGSHTALAGLNLQVSAGEVFCLLGSNGAGKTTTINLFLRFLKPTSGLVKVKGLDVANHARETKRFLGYIPEQVMLYGNLTGLENLEYFADLAGVERESRTGLLEHLRRAGLPEGAEQRRVATYSKGMRQKVAIAIALAKSAEALLLDEPTSGLDPQASNDFAQLIRELRDSGVAILMATHDLFRAKESGTRLGIMKQGHLVQTLSAQEVGHADLEQIYLRHMHG